MNTLFGAGGLSCVFIAGLFAWCVRENTYPEKLMFCMMIWAYVFRLIFLRKGLNL